MRAPKDDWTDDPAAVMEEFLAFMLDKGAGFPRTFIGREEVAAYAAILDRAGLDGAALLSSGVKALDLRNAAVLALDHFRESYLYDDKWWRGENMAAWASLTAVIEGWPEETGDPDLDSLYQEMLRCRADIERRFPLDMALCGSCGDELPAGDVEHCSCGFTLCENCYVENGHVFHDQDRDPVFDDLVEADDLPDVIAELEAIGWAFAGAGEETGDGQRTYCMIRGDDARDLTLAGLNQLLAQVTAPAVV
jgi:hypothetical protein